jgi:hypothetical protein
MAPITILIVEKSGNIKEVSIKSYDENELYKKAGLKTKDEFICRANWNLENINNKSYYISVFGKITGRANSENKYDFPPPIDNTLFFGNCIIVNKNKDNEIISITEKEWDLIYDYLFGGFEEIGDKDSEDNDFEDEDEDDGLPRTKDGYVKDDFIVDDDDDDDDEILEEEDEEEENEDEDDDYKPKSKKTKQKSKSVKENFTTSKKKGTIEKLFVKTPDIEDNYLDCTSELKEEEYI